MTPKTVPLDRVLVDGISVAPRSAMLHRERGDLPETRLSRWWVRVSSTQLPEGLAVSPDPLEFIGETAGGQRLVGEVRIVVRRDDQLGTELVLSGVRPGGGPSEEATG